MKNIIKVFKVLDLINFKYKTNIFFFVILILLNTLTEVIGFGIIFPIIDLVLSNENQYNFNFFDKQIFFFEKEYEKSELLKILIILLVLSFFFKFIFKSFFFYKTGKVFADLKTKISSILILKYMKMQFFNFQKTGQSAKIRNTINENQGFSKFYLNFIEIISNLFFIIFLIIIISYFNITIIKFTIITIVIVVILHQIFFKNKVKTAETKRINLDGIIIKKITEIFNNYKELKLTIKKNFFTDRLYLDLNNLNQQKFKISFLSEILKPAFEFILILFIGIILYQLSNENNVDLSNKAPEIGIIILALIRIFPSINRVIFLLQISFKTSKSVNVIFEEILKETDYKIDNNQNFKFEKYLNIKSLSYEYSKTKKISFDMISNIKPNSVNLIIGKSGVGKSTFLNILSGLLKPEGKIIIDDKEVDLFENKFWFDRIVYLSQNPFIFDDNLKTNILMGSLYNETEYKNIINICQLDELDKLKSLGELSTTISGGQKQRVALARVLYSKKEFIMMDEPTNMLDNTNKKELFEFIKKNKKDKTFFIVSHDKELTEISDNVIEII